MLGKYSKLDSYLLIYAVFPENWCCSESLSGSGMHDLISVQHAPTFNEVSVGDIKAHSTLMFICMGMLVHVWGQILTPYLTLSSPGPIEWVKSFVHILAQIKALMN